MSSPKSQGSSYEREIAVKLSLWYSKGKRDDIFYRSHSSGGRATNRKKAGKELKGQYGDICATDPMGKPLIDKWCVECKHGYSRKTNIKGNKKQSALLWCILDILDSEQKTSTFIELWRLAKKEARDAGKNTVPILIMQRTRRTSIIAIPIAEFNLWASLANTFVPTYIIVQRRGLSGIVIMRLEHFFDWTMGVIRNRF